MVVIALRRKYDRDELEALKAEALQRLDVSTLESVAKFQPRMQLHRVHARLEFTFRDKPAGRMMSAAALNKAAIGALGGAMFGIRGALLPMDGHRNTDLRGKGDTIFWVSDLGPETESESKFGERLMTALSSESVRFFGDCFSSIRVKSGRPSLVRVVPVEENPPLTVDEVKLNILSHLFYSGSAFLPVTTTSGHDIMDEQLWADGTLNHDVDLGPIGLTEACLLVLTFVASVSMPRRRWSYTRWVS
jgi:hypothetical protein